MPHFLISYDEVLLLSEYNFSLIISIMSSGLSVRIDEGEGAVDVKAHPVDIVVPGNVVGSSSCDPSRFDPPLPKIKDDRDLVVFIAKYQDAFSENVIIYLGGEE
ncbi:hypothetical protein F0562_030857 [Nyssa sinensis]|uniref:Uncharacterized protein n=1 Tax=Nyssa sinensis TaxID=561372 RepID=A0A5J5AXW3_9ASTE|nr:hypothetical protein F0562_030857 [Nyssa sinensis]